MGVWYLVLKMYFGCLNEMKEVCVEGRTLELGLKNTLSGCMRQQVRGGSLKRND